MHQTSPSTPSHTSDPQLSAQSQPQPELTPPAVLAFHDFLRAISQTPHLHAKFLNTLSFLEYIGSRKILKSQRAENITFDILSHTAEEIRHAQAFKKIALKMSQGKVESYSSEHLFCGAEATLYFQAIDQSAAARLSQPDPWTNYLLTTLLIEERANQIYPFYEHILAAAGFPGYLKTIVREENSHLQDIAAEISKHQPLTPELLDELRAMEDAAFQRFTKALQQELLQAS